MFKDKDGRSLSIGEVLGKIVNRIKNILLEFEVFLLHLVGCIPSHSCRRFFYRMVGIKIGKGSTIHMKARFYDPRNITIGEDTIVGEGAVLDGRAELFIGSHVDIASEVMIYNSQHDIENESFQAEDKPVKIEDFCRPKVNNFTRGDYRPWSDHRRRSCRNPRRSSLCRGRRCAGKNNWRKKVKKSKL